MKFLTVVTLTLFSLGAMADMHEGKDHKKMWDNMSFEDAKKMMTEKMDNKAAMIEKSRGCVNEAKDKDGLKKCKMEMKEEHKEMKAEMKSKMKKSM